MRKPRPGVLWTPTRVARRATYETYMSSPDWWATRRWWKEMYEREHGCPPTCAACGGKWSDLHHRTYARLGHEAHNDLVAVCRPCHTEVHRRLEYGRLYKAMGRSRATDLILMSMIQTNIRLDHRSVRRGRPEGPSQRLAHGGSKLRNQDGSIKSEGVEKDEC